jgi:hypothetical protein
MILSRRQTLSEGLDGMTVTVKRHGATWEAMVMSTNEVAFTDCVVGVTRHAAVPRTKCALVD